MVGNAPVVSCPHCNANYLTAQTLHEIDRIKTHRRSLAKPRSIVQSLDVDRPGSGRRRASHPTKPGKVTVSGQPGEDVPTGTLKAIMKQTELKP